MAKGKCKVLGWEQRELSCHAQHHPALASCPEDGHGRDGGQHRVHHSQLSITSTTPGPGSPLRCGCSKGMENRIQKSASPCPQSGLQAAQPPHTQAGSPHELEQRQPAHRERTKGGFLKTEPLQPPEKRLPKPGTCMLSHCSCV